MRLSNKKTAAISSDEINCVLRKDKCSSFHTNPLYDKVENYNLVISEQRSDSEIIGKTVESVAARSWKAIGLGFLDEQGGEIRSLTLLGGKAADRVKMDPKDILRISFVKRVN